MAFYQGLASCESLSFENREMLPETGGVWIAMFRKPLPSGTWERRRVGGEVMVPWKPESCPLQPGPRASGHPPQLDQAGSCWCHPP